MTIDKEIIEDIYTMTNGYVLYKTKNQNLLLGSLFLFIFFQ
jgi:hypothetical protein